MKINRNSLHVICKGISIVGGGGFLFVAFLHKAHSTPLQPFAFFKKKVTPTSTSPQILNYTGNFQTVTIPSGSTVDIKVWGAAGSQAGFGGGGGGGGAFVRVTYVTTSVTSFKVLVGQGGKVTNGNPNGRMFGGGGQTGGLGPQGGGGGRSQVTLIDGTPLVVAGGGGGSGAGSQNRGGPGGAAGGNGADGIANGDGGNGCTKVAGAGATQDGSVSYSPLVAAAPVPMPSPIPSPYFSPIPFSDGHYGDGQDANAGLGGAGGGGWYGGLAGNSTGCSQTQQNAPGGGGGASYYNSGLTTLVSTQAGSGINPGGTSDSDWANNAGMSTNYVNWFESNGSGGQRGDGNDGRVVIRWTTP